MSHRKDFHNFVLNDLDLRFSFSIMSEVYTTSRRPEIFGTIYPTIQELSYKKTRRNDRSVPKNNSTFATLHGWYNNRQTDRQTESLYNVICMLCAVYMRTRDKN